MLFAIGFGVLVLSLNRMASRMGDLHREGHASSALQNNTSLASHPGAPLDDPHGASVASGDTIPTDLDTSEAHLRKKHGLILRNGVWLPAIPYVSKGGKASLDITGASPDDIAYTVPLYITTGRIPDAMAGRDYKTRIEAVGGIPPYSWSLDSGALTSALAFSRATGELTGKPAAADTRTIRVRVTDSVGMADVAEYQLRITELLDPASTATLALDKSSAEMSADGTTIAAADAAAVTTTTTDPATEPDPTTDDPAKKESPLAIVATPLPEAMVKQNYSAALTATGGQPPYAWTAATALPDGLTLSATGALTGTPKTAGEVALTIAVSDQAGHSAMQTFALRIKSALPDRVIDLAAFISLRRVGLTWKNPADPSAVAVRIVRNPSRPPADERDGIVIYEGQGTSAIDPSLTFGDYHYAAFTLTADGLASEPIRASVSLRADADPFADAVADRRLLHASAYNATALPGIVLGPPRGGGVSAGSLDVVSLGAATFGDGGGEPYGGSIVISFENNLVCDGPGADFTVFENVFYINGTNGAPDPNQRMMEPATVSVSQDGTTWFTFPTDFSPRYDPTTGALNLRHPFVFNKGFAGVNPVIANGTSVDPTDTAVSGGDSFDLADLRVPGLTWIRYIRLQSTGNKWLTDSNGDLIYHPTDSGAALRSVNKSGFDLDAVTAIWLGAVTGE